MQVFSSTVNQMIVLFIFMALGFFLTKKKLVPDNGSVILSKLETFVFVPCLVFNTFYRYCTVGNFKEKWIYIVYGLAVIVFSLPIGIGLAHAFSKEEYLQTLVLWAMRWCSEYSAKRSFSII